MNTGITSRLNDGLFEHRPSREMMRAFTFEPGQRLSTRIKRLVLYYGILAMRTMVTAGKRLDGWLHPSLHDTPVTSPVMVYANARSGTTLMHSLLSLDEQRFVNIKLYHTLLHSLTFDRLARAFVGLDRAVGAPLAKAMTAFEERLWAFWDGVHRMGLHHPEEDEAWFLYSFRSAGMMMIQPPDEDNRHLMWLNEAPLPEQLEIAKELLGLVQRRMFDYPGRTFLNKSVFLQCRSQAFDFAFPDAQYIYMVRHPAESIPSYLSMATKAWDFTAPDLEDRQHHMEHLIDHAIAMYRQGHVLYHSLPEHRRLLVNYHRFIQDPEATVRRVYQHFGLTLSDRYAKTLHRACEQAKRPRKAHTYDLEAFGLTRERLHAELGDIMEELGFDP